MNNLRTLCLLAILIPHCVYAEYSPKFVLFDPATGQQIEPRVLGSIHLRSRRQINGPEGNESIIVMPRMASPCACEDYVCRCCVGIGFAGINQTTCVRIEYEWRIFGVTVAIEWNDQLLTSFGLSARNMPDFCAPLVLPLPILTCVRFSDIEIVEADDSLNMCMSLVFKIIFSEFYEYKFNCMRLGGYPRAMNPKLDAMSFEERAENTNFVGEEAEDMMSEDLMVGGESNNFE